jgi:hypothetical protein
LELKIKAKNIIKIIRTIKDFLLSLVMLNTVATTAAITIPAKTFRPKDQSMITSEYDSMR